MSSDYEIHRSPATEGEHFEGMIKGLLQRIEEIGTEKAYAIGLVEAIINAPSVTSGRCTDDQD